MCVYMHGTKWQYIRCCKNNADADIELVTQIVHGIHGIHGVRAQAAQGLGQDCY